ncbi:MAG: outer membrane beta-barrel protein, partial [Bdellovibrionales bacterium]|nr:outer membrane beta-barrel protein [Bdellovibrionales bacterium]
GRRRRHYPALLFFSGLLATHTRWTLGEIWEGKFLSLIIPSKPLALCLKMRIMNAVLKFAGVLIVLLIAQPSFAVMELGATANYRKSIIDDNNYQESSSVTGSLSYYFWEMSAIELSYTQGASRVSIKAASNDPRTIITSIFSLTGLDFVFTFAGKDSVFQPYVKLGGAYIKKENFREQEGLATSALPSQKGVVPSAGIGFKIRLTEAFSIKAGVDAWTSPLGKKNPDGTEEKVTIDYAGRVGFSWFF